MQFFVIYFYGLLCIREIKNNKHFFAIFFSYVSIKPGGIANIYLFESRISR
jgi:hypothetical protein